MFKHEIREQITEAYDLVNMCTIENLNTDMWKYQIIKMQEERKKQELQSIIELPRYSAFVRSQELILGKSRREFTHLERESIERQYYEIYK